MKPGIWKEDLKEIEMVGPSMKEKETDISKWESAHRYNEKKKNGLKDP